MGGGALLDAGSNCLSLIRLLTGRAPQRMQASARVGPTGIDNATDVTLHFADGAVAQLSCAMDMAMHRPAMGAGT
jgi:predicted dehydrogenase